MLTRHCRTLVAVLLLCPAAPALAAVPSTLGYQGLLTDGGGSPVPTGAYDLAFAIYDVPSGGTALWTEAHPAVGVVNGSFAVTLGSVNPLTGVAFDRPYWLGISVGAAPELAPRVELAASPYALGLRTPFAMESADTIPTLRVSNTMGLALDVASAMRVGSGGDEGFVDVRDQSGGPGVITFGGNPNWPSRVDVFTLESELGLSCRLGRMFTDDRAGELYLAGGVSGRFARIRGDYLGTDSPRLDMHGSGGSFIVNTHLAGDSAVMLAAGSIGPDEMMGVPGISHTEAGLVTIGSTMGAVVATTITTPRDGYIRVTAGGEVRLSGTTGANAVTYQISTNPAAAEDPAVSRAAGSHQYVSTVFQFFTANAERIYFLPAGEHTFYLQARRDAAPGGTAGITNPSITAAFFPVSYGSVVSTMETGETTDLRTLELRALQARLEAERAERALEVARAKDEVPSMAPALASTARGR